VRRLSERWERYQRNSNQISERSHVSWGTTHHKSNRTKSSGTNRTLNPPSPIRQVAQGLSSWPNRERSKNTPRPKLNRHILIRWFPKTVTVAARPCILRFDPKSWPAYLGDVRFSETPFVVVPRRKRSAQSIVAQVLVLVLVRRVSTVSIHGDEFDRVPLWFLADVVGRRHSERGGHSASVDCHG
jgi:hypothetical protein